MADRINNPNIYEPLYDEPREELDGFTAYRARIGHQLGTERVGLSMWLLPAGEVSLRAPVEGAVDQAQGPLRGLGRARRADGPDHDGLKMYFNLDDAVPCWAGITRPEVGDVDPA